MTTLADLARADQHHAAVTDAARRARLAAATRTITAANTGDPWLMAHISQLLADIRDHQVMTCVHLTDHTPRVLYAMVWAPCVITCETCTYLMTPTEAEDTTCDRCRQQTTTIRPHLAAVGPVLLGYGLCPTCTNTTAPPADRPAPPSHPSQEPTK